MHGAAAGAMCGRTGRVPGRAGCPAGGDAPVRCSANSVPTWGLWAPQEAGRENPESWTNRPALADLGKENAVGTGSAQEGMANPQAIADLGQKESRWGGSNTPTAGETKQSRNYFTPPFYRGIRSMSSMGRDTKRIEQEFKRMLSGLSCAEKEELYLFMSLLAQHPGFCADLKANTPEREKIPRREVVRELMAKWSLSESA